MFTAADQLKFEYAAKLRDEIKELSRSWRGAGRWPEGGGERRHRHHGRARAQPQGRLARLPRDRFIVITGLSGSGKRSLAFDTIYAEGQRRYVESLSAYARQFLGQMDKPDVDSIEGLSPAISIDQRTTSRNPRSTVGTATEIYDYLRLLYARVGHPHCPKCGRPIEGQSLEQIVDQVCELEAGTRFSVVAPLVRGRKGEYGKLFGRCATRASRASRWTATCASSTRRSCSTSSTSTTSRWSSTGW